MIESLTVEKIFFLVKFTGTQQPKTKHLPQRIKAKRETNVNFVTCLPVQMYVCVFHF